ncbi:unnamed protein product [Candidula unifasciata]|uniref:Protein regulator of cytokinesis 1 n=1 Tax=Candidula unifasciata TaxID=100452 RepID=A0A8S3YPT7_9EUPU|nr:unnamed protein product [Candidula unifasciata]
MEGNTSSSPCREQTRFACNKIIDTSIRALYQIWDKMGIDESQKKARGDTAVAHMKNLMQHMIAEEEALMKQVAQTIDEYTEKLDLLCNDLSLPHIRLSGGLTMVQKEKILRSKVETMAKEKKDRMAKYDILHSRDEHLSEVLSTPTYTVSPGKVPTLEQLRELEKHVARLQEERDKRFTELVTTKKKIMELYSLIEFEPDTPFGCELICEDDDSLGLSTENMDKLSKLHDELVRKNEAMKTETDNLWERLRSLWNRLDTCDIDREEFELKINGHGTKAVAALKGEIEACELLKLQNIRKFVDGIRSELISWWDKCYFSEEQRSGFKAFSEGECTEELLQIHEQELESVRQYYNTNKDILEKIARREELFRNMVVFEEKASDPNRFFSDRGGRLLQEEKARKKLMKELPKVEEEVTEAILKWESDNQKDFLVNGMKFPDFVKNSWENFQSQKDQQKQLRLKARVKQAQDDVAYGSKSGSQTPSKRKVPQSASTPVRTPLKARKVEMGPSVSVKVRIQYDMLNDVPTTPSTTSKLPTRYQHNTLVHTPGKQSTFTPKTPLSKSAKRRSSRLKRRSAAKHSLSSKNRRKSRDIFAQGVENKRNDSSASLAAHGSYQDFTNCVIASKASSPDTQHT